MICHEVQLQLSEYLDKSLDAIRMKSIDAHLIACPGCRAEANGLSECIRHVADLAMVEPPAGFAQRVMAQVRGIEIEPRGWQRFLAALRSTVPIQAAAVVMITVVAVLLYQKEVQITESDPARFSTAPGTVAAPEEGRTNAAFDRSGAPSPRSTARPATVAAQARREQPQATAPIPATGVARQAPAAETAGEGRISAPRRPAIQAQEVATGGESLRPRPDEFGFGAAIGALSRLPLHNAPFAPPERSFSPLSEPSADIEFIVRRRPFERRDQTEESDAARKRSETDAAIASAAVKRSVPPPASPASSIVEIRWFSVPADRYEQFRNELIAEAHIDSERSTGGMDHELATQSARELLIKVVILPSQR